MNQELLTLTISELSELLDRREITAEELFKNTVERYKQVEGDVQSFVFFDEEGGLEAARKIDSKGRSSKLSGIPLALKDNLFLRGNPVTCASKILAGHRAPYSATVVKKLIDAGAVIVGNTNMDEFAMGSSTENSAYKTTRNPRDLTRVPGGSSGGSAAAVAAGIVPAALGSDTGGSIRQPAAFCGVVGFKPTYGRVSRYGLVPFASSLDQIGPLTRTVEDAALLAGTISGYDRRDSTSLEEPVPNYLENLRPSAEGLTIGIPAEYYAEGTDSEVRELLESTISELEDSGAQIEELSMPHTEYAISTYYILATAEASSNLARYDGVQYGMRADAPDGLLEMYSETREAGFGDEVKRRIMLGTFVLSSGYYEAYYGKAQKLRTLIKQDFENAFEKCDLLLTPTAPTTAFKIGEKVDDLVQMYLSDILTASTNLAGLPAVSLPVGTDAKMLPVGAQLIGPVLSEQKLLNTASLLEEISPWQSEPALFKEE